MRVGQQAERGERASTEGQPRGHLGAGPSRVQPWPEYRGSQYFAEHVGGGEHSAQRVPAGAVADQEDERERRHRDRQPGADGYQCPARHRSGGELAVTHEGVTPWGHKRARTWRRGSPRLVVL